MDQRICVLMSVYKNDVAANVKAAVESIINQTLPPQQVIVVVDGPVAADLKTVLETLAITYPLIELVWLPENVGLGQALAIGTEHCHCPFIARMDSDDLAVPTRFEKQMAYFAAHPETSVVGSNGQEFYDEIEHLAGLKQVPENHAAIVEFMKRRCPFCHMSVIIKKDALIKAGGYQSFLLVEDWYLWIRLYLAGAIFHNLQEPLVFIRINHQTFARRHGRKYYQNIKGILKYLREQKLLNWWQYTREKLRRFVGHVMVPRCLKDRLYRKYLRKQAHA